MINELFFTETQGKHYKQNTSTSFDFFTALKTALQEIMPHKVAEIFASEFGVFYYGFFHWHKEPLKANEFSHHHKSGTPTLLGVLIFMSGIEASALHFVAEHFWGVTLAWVFTATSVYTALQIFGFMRSLSKRPIVVQKDQLVLRYGLMAEATIAFHNIDTIEKVSPTASITYNKLVRHFSPLGDMEKPNIMIKLHHKSKMSRLYGFKRKYQTLYFHVDAPDEFKEKADAELAAFSQ